MSLSPPAGTTSSIATGTPLRFWTWIVRGALSWPTASDANRTNESTTCRSSQWVASCSLRASTATRPTDTPPAIRWTVVVAVP